MPPGSAAAEEDGDASFSVVAALQSQYNEIVVVDTPESRVLLLDSTRMLILFGISCLFSFGISLNGLCSWKHVIVVLVHV